MTKNIRININGTSVEVSAETYKRIEKIASAKKMTFTEAVSFCLEKVI